MCKFRVVTILLALVFVFSFTVRAENSWAGVYEFFEDGGQTAGGTKIFVAHQIEILETDDGLIAMIQSNGFQTARELIGTTRVEGEKLLIFFENYGENNTFETFGKGELLLTFERKKEKGKEQILTHWGKFQPVVPKNEKSGKVYFEKT